MSLRSAACLFELALLFVNHGVLLDARFLQARNYSESQTVSAMVWCWPTGYSAGHAARLRCRSGLFLAGNVSNPPASPINLHQNNLQADLAGAHSSGRFDCGLALLVSKSEGLAGMSPWVLTDFRSPRRMLPKIKDGFNRKGLISSDGKKKAAFSSCNSSTRLKRQQATDCPAIPLERYFLCKITFSL